MKSGLVNSMSSLTVAQGSSWLFSFATTDTYSANKIDIRVKFPKEFTTNKAGCEMIGSSAKINSEVLYD